MVETASNPSHGLGILLVDGDPYSRAALEELLTSRGYHVTSVPAFEDAWRLMSRQRPELLFTTARLGRFNGLHLALRGRFNHAGLPVIVLADPGEQMLAVEVEQMGARFVVNDGFAQQRILAVVAELFDADPRR